MPKRTNEALTDIAEMGKLAETLLPPEPDDYLMFNAANSLLDQDGTNTTVNGLNTVVTKSFYPIAHGDKKLFVRLGREIRGTSYGDLSFLLCESDELEFITTPNGYFSNLQFNFGAGKALLIAGTGENYDTKDPQYRMFAQEAIDGITKAHLNTIRNQQAKDEAARRKADERAAEERKRKQENRQNKIDNAKYRSKQLAGWAVCLAIAYAPQVIWSDKVDVKVAGVPMPQPIEGIRDIADDMLTYSDTKRAQEEAALRAVQERALSFKPTEGAAPLELGKPFGKIPLITSYDTRNAPNVNEVGGSLPGLYRYDFVYGDYEGSSFRDDGDCITMSGNFRDGKTTVFTQNTETPNIIQVSAPDADNVKICRTEAGTDTNQDKGNDSGSIFFYQKP